MTFAKRNTSGSVEGAAPNFAYPRSVTRTAADAIAWREKEAARAVRLPPGTPEPGRVTAAPLDPVEMGAVVEPAEVDSGFPTGAKIAAASVGAAIVMLSMAIVHIA